MSINIHSTRIPGIGPMSPTDERGSFSYLSTVRKQDDAVFYYLESYST